MYSRLLWALRVLLRLVAIGVLVVIATTVLIVLSVAVSTRGAIYRSATLLSPHEVALVLGASIKSTGELSPVLKERADGAIALYKAGLVQKILVSGDNATLQYNEVYPVGKYLLSSGVPQKDIFLDYAGFDTYSSMYRAKHIFGVTSMVVTSQRFHLPRALFIAKQMGIEVVGFDVSQQGDDYSQNTLREVPATIKAIADLSMRRTPHYLGSTFFVEGDGTATWVGSTSQMIYFKDE